MTFKNLLKSKTLWAFAGMFVVGGLQATQSFFTAEQFMVIETILTAVGVWGRVKPVQTF